MQYLGFFKHERYRTFLCNIDILSEKYGKFPHEIIALEPWQFELLMMCNEARTQYDRGEKDREREREREREMRREGRDYVGSVDVDVDVDEHTYFNQLDPIEKENYIKLKSLDYDPIPRVSLSSL